MAFLPSTLHVNRPLTDLVVSYAPSSDGYLRDKLFPRKPVAHKADQIRQISRAQLLRLYPMITGPGGRVHQVQFGTDTTLTYNATTFALETTLDNEERQNADTELAYDMRQMQAPLLGLNQGLEQLAIVNTARQTSILTQNATLGTSTYWSNYSSSSSDPIEDLMTACMRVNTQTGKKVNFIGMDLFVWKKLAQHPNVLSRSPVHTTPAGGQIMTPSLLEQVLEAYCEKGSVHITMQRYNSANEGATEVLTSFMGPDVIVAHTDAPSAMPGSYGLGFEFAWNGMSGSDPFLVLQYQDLNRGPLGSDVLRLVAAVDYKVTNPKAGYLIKTTVDTSLSEFNSELSV